MALIYIYNMESKEEWLSGLKHWFAKSKYNFFCTMGSNPFSSKIRINFHLSLLLNYKKKSQKKYLFYIWKGEREIFSILFTCDFFKSSKPRGKKEVFFHHCCIEGVEQAKIPAQTTFSSKHRQLPWRTNDPLILVLQRKKSFS